MWWPFRRQRDDLIETLIKPVDVKFKGFDSDLRDRTARRKARRVNRIERFKERLARVS